MSAKDLNELIAKYTEPQQAEPGSRTVSFSTRIGIETKLKLGALSAHLEVKKTPLFGEIAEAAINDLFERLHDDMDEHIQRGYAEDLDDYYRTGE